MVLMDREQRTRINRKYFKKKAKLIDIVPCGEIDVKKRNCKKCDYLCDY